LLALFVKLVWGLLKSRLPALLCVIALAAIVQFLQASELQQLQQLVQQAVPNDNSSSSLTPTDAAAAYAAVTRLSSGNQPAAAAAAAPVLQLLAPAWQSALPAATIQDVANVLLCLSKLRYNNAQLWGSSLAAVPALCSDADGQDLANVALALATAAEAGGGAVPGVTREEAEEVLRWVQLATCLFLLCNLPRACCDSSGGWWGCCAWCDQARG
jgi:hypothetical protein